MTAVSRASEIWKEIAAHAASRGDRVSVTDVCAAAPKIAGVDGAWVTAYGEQAPDFMMCVTDAVGEQLAEQQLTLGEGPCPDALASAAPVLAENVEDAAYIRRWPAFTPEACRTGAKAVFAFPLMIGAIRAGLLGLYRCSPGLLGEHLGDCLILADVTTLLLLGDLGVEPGGGMGEDAAALAGQAPDLALHRAEIDQATGMLTVQLGVTAAEAFVRLRAYAHANAQRLSDVAGDIVARRLILSPGPGKENQS